ncbi:MAG: sterol desaturase family protein [Chitinophagales bacterium]|nr:sterol desaturase family protein [Chitinophagales bacterium]
MAILISFFTGIVLWTLAEYLMHRFLGHEHKGKNFFKAEHGQHHAKYNYFAPAYKKALLAVVVTVLLFAVLQLVINASAALAFLAGFLGMYILYEATHYRFHIRKPVAKPFIVLRKHHFYHHFHNPKTNHGVTTRFWDRVFGTFVPVEKVRVPRKMAMQWLLQEEEIKPDYAPHFYLAG